ncbi:hypothetical protein L345_13777, partial [Ophiophagus hannah]
MPTRQLHRLCRILMEKNQRLGNQGNFRSEAIKDSFGDVEETLDTPPPTGYGLKLEPLKASPLLGMLHVERRYLPAGIKANSLQRTVHIGKGEDDLKMLAILERHLMMLFRTPLGILKCVERNFVIPVKVRVEVEGNVGSLMLAAGKIHPESGREKKKEEENLVPYSSNIPGGLKSKRTIIVAGSVPDDAIRFLISFVTSSEVALEIAVDPNRKEVLCKSYVNGRSFEQATTMSLQNRQRCQSRFWIHKSAPKGFM